MDVNELEEGLELNVQFEKRGGIVPTIVQDYETSRILMLAYVNPEALRITLETKRATFWSTSRDQLWIKGSSSGNYMEVRRVLVDCDQDALIYQVNCPGKGACHTRDVSENNRRSCFYRRISGNRLEFLEGEK